VSSEVQLRGLPFARAVAVHSLGWLAAANLVGVWLGVSVLWPAAGNLLAPLTYGRWSPLHLDWQLYGWCSMPVVGALLAWGFDLRHPHVRRHAQVALGSWSAALALGGVAWLGGTVSGKLFLDWHGWARPLLPLAMHILWALLAVHTWWRGHACSGARALRIVILVLLLIVPSVLYWSMGRAVPR
jgi:cytochrome c oxidase cbb3-type subunit 1